MALPIYRAMSYGPNSPGATAADQRQIRGAFVDRLQPGDIAISPNLLSQFPALSRVDAIDPNTGEVLRSGLRVADTSWISSGHPTTNSFELYNDKDLGHANLVPHDPSNTTNVNAPAPSYLAGPDSTTAPTPTTPLSASGSPLLDQMRQLQVAQSLLGSRGLGLGGGLGAQGGSNQVVSALQNAIKQAQLIQQLRGGSSGGLTGGLSDFLGSGAYRAGLTQADPFGAGGAFDVAAA